VSTVLRPIHTNGAQRLSPKNLALFKFLKPNRETAPGFHMPDVHAVSQPLATKQWNKITPTKKWK